MLSSSSLLAAPVSVEGVEGFFGRMMVGRFAATGGGLLCVGGSGFGDVGGCGDISGVSSFLGDLGFGAV